jgi:nucleoside-diphosphate-sugar epimerase
MKGCSAVFHTASPFIDGSGKAAEPQKDLVDPAVKGTENVLNEASTTWESVSRLVTLLRIRATVWYCNIGKNSGTGLAFQFRVASVMSAP